MWVATLSASALAFGLQSVPHYPVAWCIRTPAPVASHVDNAMDVDANYSSKKHALIRAVNLKQQGKIAVEEREAKASMIKALRLKLDGAATIEARDARAAALLQLHFAAAVKAQQATRDIDMIVTFRGEVTRREAKSKAVAEARAVHSRLATAARVAWEAADQAQRALADAEQRLACLEADEAMAMEVVAHNEAVVGVTLTLGELSCRVFVAVDSTTDQLADEARRLHKSMEGVPLELWLRGEVQLMPGAPLSAALHRNSRANHVVIKPAIV